MTIRRCKTGTDLAVSKIKAPKVLFWSWATSESSSRASFESRNSGFGLYLFLGGSSKGSCRDEAVDAVPTVSYSGPMDLGDAGSGKQRNIVGRESKSRVNS